MSGVYGSFIENFIELMDTFIVWTSPDRSDERTVRAILMPNKGSGIKRRKFTSGNTALEITDDNDFYISRKYDDKVKEGDYIQKKDDNIIMRLVKNVPYDKAAGYRVYGIERVTGATSNMDEQLVVKEATFD